MVNRKRRAKRQIRGAPISTDQTLRGDRVSARAETSRSVRRWAVGPRLRRAAAWSAGSTLVEMALLAPVLIGLLAGAWDFANVIQEGSKIASAARAGAQFAIQSEANATDTAGIATAVRTDAEDDANALTVASLTFCRCVTGGGTVPCNTTCSGGGEPRTYVSVDVSRTYHMFFPYPFVHDPLVLREAVTMRVQ